MNRIAIFFATGYEEIEALTVVDICRRLGLAIDMVSVTGETCVTGSHGIEVKMDQTLAQIDFDSYDMLVLPGGMPGTKHLEACEPLMEQIDRFYQSGKYVAAICAAPGVLGHRGILKGRKACSYPSAETRLEGAQITSGPVEIDGNVVTSRGMGTAIDFALAIGTLFCGQEKVEELAKGIIYK